MKPCKLFYFVLGELCSFVVYTSSGRNERGKNYIESVVLSVFPVGWIYHLLFYVLFSVV